MSEHADVPYSQTYIVAWTALSIIISAAVFAALFSAIPSWTPATGFGT